MASVDDCIINSAQSADGNIIPHVKSSHGFTVYFEMSGKNIANKSIIFNNSNSMYQCKLWSFLYLGDKSSYKLSEVIVIEDESNERLDFLEECLLRKQLNPNQADFAECLLKEAERVFEHGGNDGIVLEECDDADPEKPEETPICQYFLKGKCRFGKKCFNLHKKTMADEIIKDELAIEDDLTKTLKLENKADNVKSKSHKQKNKIVESEKQRKKPPMKTATDVINRIQWDEKLNPEHFTVGYLDRFVGIVENSFNSFDWEDVTSLDPNILAIPKHRIQYFKFNDEIVWDKNKRLDHVFGSTGSGMTIIDVIENSNKDTETATDTENETIVETAT